MKRLLIAGVDAVVALMVPLARAGRALGRGPRRLVRLASLRAQAGSEVPASTQFDGPVSACGSGRLSLGEQCRLGRDVHFDTAARGRITIGHRVRLNAGCVVVANAEVVIGDDTLVGEYVSIRDANHGIAPDEPMRLQPQTAAPIRIGRDVWIGRGSCILRGVTIGDGAVVGANSVVTRDVPPRAIHAGVPAREIGVRGVRGGGETNPV